jgi:hypothetical protein
LTYYCEILTDRVKAFKDDKLMGVFDYEDFFLSVISPLELKRFERNESKSSFYIRKLEFNIYNKLNNNKFYGK